MQQQSLRIHGALLGAWPPSVTSPHQTSARLTHAACTSLKEGSVAAVPAALRMSVRRDVVTAAPYSIFGAGSVQSVHCLGRRSEG
jgi:hypothetical protein